ncbi:MAG: SH3 domain-containing protein [Dysgonamonadaceae bacterium]|nr:SH3 domain-containing protein [Fermentimonas sp.]MDD3901739.1 SH3 domain-containing protein [Dysgonamonadaceae bacterium]
MLLGIASFAMAGVASADNATTSDGTQSSNSNITDSGSIIKPMWMNQFHVTTSVLNVRSGAGTSYGVVGTLYQGNTGFLYDASEIQADGYTWVPIYNSSHTARWGWIAKQYIQIDG